ncbi:MAG: cation-translocating P-type ATPase [Methanomassiliicoccales archaeon]
MALTWHSLKREDVVSALDTDAEKGLSEEEARARLEKYGFNEIVRSDALSPLKIFASQFKNLMVIILVIAAVVSATIGALKGSSEEWLDATVIMVIVILNAILGFVQEYKAERTLEALKKLASPDATVIRNGKEKDIPSSHLVPGDIIILKTGDKIPADGRLLESINLKVNEASLTGESMPASKDAGIVLDEDTYISDRENMVFSGSTIEYGRGIAVVTSTGMNTELGKIAHMIQEEESETPLQKKLANLGKQLGFMVLGVSIFIFIVGLIRNVAVEEMFLTAVSLAVAAIPEGLPAVVTISLALGLQRMASRNALIRKLPAVESLGSATVICTDKTGTLTKGEMSVREIWIGDTIQVTGEGFTPEGEFTKNGEKISPQEVENLKWLITAGALCNDASLVFEENRWSIRGDTTEGALLVMAKKAGIDLSKLNEEFPRIYELPFDSVKKRMITVHERQNRIFAFLKGATESTLAICSKRYVDGTIVDLSDEEKKKIMDKNNEMASRALRVLAIAMKEIEDFERDDTQIERGFIFLGLVGMSDAPRKEAIEAVKKAKNAGIRVIMITGDHELTAKSIAVEMGIADTLDPKVISGSELEKLSVEELSKRVKEVSIFARVAPEHKVKIVEALKRNGEIVAMTGDGVNDAPALKKADIGVAMGITGTDVSKEASEMVLTDDNFASIVHAVEEGRGIYDNIKRFVEYLLSCNAGEVAAMFIATLALADPAFLPFLLPIQILWMNLVTDGLPALSLGVEPIADDVMERLPRDPREKPITRHMAYRIVTVGIIMAISTNFAFFLEYYDTGDIVHARTVAFCTIVFSQLFYAFSARSERKTIKELGIRSNPKVLYAFIISALLQLAVIYIYPLNSAFKTVPIGIDEWVIVLIFGSIATIAMESWKIITRIREKNTRLSSQIELQQMVGE